MIKLSLLSFLKRLLLLLGGDIETNPGPRSPAAKKRARLVRRVKVAEGILPPRVRRRRTRAAKLDKALTLLGSGAYNPVPGARPRLMGRGPFWDVLKRGLSYLPRAIGGASGLMTNGFSGATKGWEEGARLSKLIGLGAYSRVPGVRPGGTQVQYADPVPAIRTTAESCTISRTEYMGDVFASATAGAFQNTTYSFNPGVMLNWGSSLASLFQEWSLEGACVSFRSRSSSYTQTTTLGTVMIAMDYNAAASAFTTKQQMEECGGMASCSIDQNCDMYVESDKAQNSLGTLYVRTGSVPSGSDVHNYDLGLLQVATSGCAASANVGELFISYCITFRKPIAVSGITIPSAHYTLTSPSATHVLGTPVKKVDTIGLTFTASTNDSINFPIGTSGTFLIQISYTGSAATIAFPGSSSVNMTNVNLWTGDSVAGIVGGLGSSNTVEVISVCATITDPSKLASYTFVNSGSVIPISATSADLIVTEINPTITS